MLDSGGPPFYSESGISRICEAAKVSSVTERQLLTERLEEFAAALARDHYWRSVVGPKRRRELDRARIGPTPRGRPRNIAVDHFVQDLMGLWIDLGHDFATSVGAPERKDEGKATGPFVRFLEVCCSTLAERLERLEIIVKSGEFTADLAAALRKLTAGALRRRVQRTGWPSVAPRPRGGYRSF